jgi:diacylglycerol kinase family enzyme
MSTLYWRRRGLGYLSQPRVGGFLPYLFPERRCGVAAPEAVIATRTTITSCCAVSDALVITVILHIGSGHGDAHTCEQEIRAGFQARGCAHRILVAHSAEEVEQQTRLAVAEARASPQVIVAAGGDGTINLIAGLVLEQGLPFGVIPLGTFNYFARDLGIPLDPRAAAEAIATGHIRRVHVARVNGHLFLNNASFGLYRKLLEQREHDKQRFGRYKFVAVFSALTTVWRFRQVYTLRMELDGKAVTLRTPMLFFGLNSLQLEKLDLDVASCTNAGQMAVIALKPSGQWQLLRLALRGALRGLHDSPELRCHGASQVLVEQPGRLMTRVAVDGESFECSLPLRFEVDRDALQVVVPQSPEVRK